MQTRVVCRSQYALFIFLEIIQFVLSDLSDVINRTLLNRVLSASDTHIVRYELLLKLPKCVRYADPPPSFPHQLSS